MAGVNNAKEIAELKYVIPILDTLYEQGDDCVHPITGKIVTDPEYDAMRARLAFLNPKSKILKDVTASQVSLLVKKVKHNPPMTSIHKAIGTLDERKAELEKWLKNVVAELGYKTPATKWACQAYKLDGVACALYYQKGNLVSAGLRPRDGVSGEDVTENAQYVEGVAKQLPVPFTGTIRGEIICKRSVFKKINDDRAQRGEDTFANPRNYAAGSIRQFKDPTVTRDRQLSFIAYVIISDDMTDKDEIERAKYCNKVLKVPHVQVRPFVYDDLKKMEDNVPNLDYEVDGVVLSVRDIDDRDQMGHHGGSTTNPPKGRLAWKFEEEHVDVPVQAFVWETGRTGGIVPVANFAPIQLAGTTVTFCTGHNLGFLQRNKIGVGTIIRVIKSGQIIPKIIGVISNHATPDYPKQCPSCGHPTFVAQGANADMVELMCMNVICPARTVSSITHYLTTLGVKGVAESTVQKLYNSKLVTTPDDLYTLTAQQLQDIGLGNRNSRLCVARIHMVDQAEKIDDTALDTAIKKAIGAKKKVPLWQFFAALGIEGAGKTAGRALMNHFGDFQAIRKASVAELTAVEGIGEKTAEVICEFFQNNADLVDHLMEHVELELPQVGKLSKYTFCLTGGFPGGKSAIEKKIEAAGGKTSGSVSKKVDFVVIGTDAGSKEAKADQLGIKKITLAELEKML